MKNLELIKSKFGDDFKTASHGEVTFNCPFCLSKRGKADNDHKLYVNTNSLKFHCFKCGTSGRLKSVNYEESSYGVYEKLLKLKEVDLPVTDEEENVFYLPMTKIQRGTVAYDYCIKRGITEDLINYYDIRLGVDDLTGRIVIPNNVYNHCWCDMYSARSIMNQIPKYKNPIGAKKNEMVFNLKNIQENQDKVIIVEGVITAISGGKDCVAVYGCHPTIKQIRQIVDKHPKSIYCCLDGDEAGQSGMMPLLEMLSGIYNGKIYYVKMPEDQDACDMGYERFRKYIEHIKKEYDGKFLYSITKKFDTLRGNLH